METHRRHSRENKSVDYQEKYYKNQFNTALKKQIWNVNNVKVPVVEKMYPDQVNRNSWAIVTKRNAMEVLKHVAALIYMGLVIYIMYYILDMAFGPKAYKISKREL